MKNTHYRFFWSEKNPNRKYENEKSMLYKRTPAISGCHASQTGAHSIHLTPFLYSVILLLSLSLSTFVLMDSHSRSSVIIVGAGVSGDYLPRHNSYSPYIYTSSFFRFLDCLFWLFFFFFVLLWKVFRRRRCWLRTASRTSWSWRLPTVSAAGSGRKASAASPSSSAPVGSPASAAKSPILFGNSPPNQASEPSSPTTAMHDTTSTIAGSHSCSLLRHFFLYRAPRRIFTLLQSLLCFVTNWVHRNELQWEDISERNRWRLVQKSGGLRDSEIEEPGSRSRCR